MVFAFEYRNYYQVCVTDGTKENSFSFQYLKDQNLEVSIRESELIVADEIQKNEMPVSV